MIPWTVHATFRTTYTVDEPISTALAQLVACRGGLTRASSAQELWLRFTVHAATHACAYNLALELLATEALPLLQEASLTDLRLLAGQHGLTPSPAVHP